MKVEGIIKTQLDILRVFIGLVFLSAGVYRIFNYSDGVREMQLLHLPGHLVIGVITLEIICGMLFLLNKWIRLITALTILGLSFAVVMALVTNWHSVITNIGELFVFDATPTDILLHITFIIILGLLFITRHQYRMDVDEDREIRKAIIRLKRLKEYELNLRRKTK